MNIFVPKSFSMKKFLLFYILAVLQTMSFGQSFSLQIINNSTSGAPQNLFPVDIYINDSLYTTANSVNYKSATALLSIPLKETTRIAIATAPSDSAGQAFAVYNLSQFEANRNYIVVLNGGFGNTQHPFRLELAAGITNFPLAEDRLQIRPFNGLGNFQTAKFEIQASGQTAAVLNPGQFSSFKALSPGRQILNFFVGGDPAPLRFSLDLPDADSLAYTLLSTGLVEGFPFPGLYAVATDGTVVPGVLLNLPDLVINEIDYEQPGTDDEEFIELKNTGNAAISLDGLSLVLYNGSVGNSYQEIELPAIDLPAEAYFVICFGGSVANCDLQVEGSIQNGGTDPDAVLLMQEEVIIDAVSYEGTLVSITEGSSVNLADSEEENKSISRLPDGVDQHNNDLDFALVCSTPGTINLPNSSCFLPSSQDSTLVQVINDYEGPEQLRLLIGDRDLGLLNYQSASAFVKVPAEVLRDVTVLNNSENTITTLLDTSLSFSTDSIYTFVVEGTQAVDMSLEINPLARAAARAPFATDFNFYHGLPNQEELDVLIKRVGFAARELSSFAYSAYNSALPGIYLLDIINHQDGEVIATFELDMRATGGGARTILISRSVDQASGIELYSFDRLGNRITLPLVEFAEVQLIQNIPNIEVDVYIDDVLFADNVNYRSATPFLEIRANKSLSLEIKGAESTPSDPPILDFDDIRFDALSSSLLVLGGDGTESSPVDLFILKNVLQESTDPEQLTLAYFHGGTDIDPISFLGEQFEPLAIGLDFGRFADYTTFEGDDLVFAVRESDTGRNLGFYGSDLSFKKGQAGLVFSSGVLEDSQTFGLFVAFADGSVVPLQSRAYTRLQLVNNAPDTNIYNILFNGRPLAEGLAFREATPYLNIPAGIAGSLQLSQEQSTGDSLLTLRNDFTFLDSLTYQLFLGGLSSDPSNPLQFAINDQAKENTGLDFGLDITVHNGIFSFGPQNWSSEGGIVLAGSLSFGAFMSTPGLSPTQQLIRISEQGTNRSLGVFEASLDQITPGTALTLFTSGLRNTTFGTGLYAVLPDGRILSFASTAFAKWQLVNNINETFDLYLDGELLVSGLDYRSAIPFQTIKAGVEYDLALVPAGADLVQQNGRRLSFTAQPEEVLSVFAAGEELENGLFLNREAADNAGGENKFVFNFFQGSSTEGALDLIIQNFTRLYREVPFGEFTDYTLIEPLSSDPMVIFEVARSSDEEVIGVYDADFLPFSNQAMTIFTSGVVGEDFALWAALPDGMTFPFSIITDLSTKALPALAIEVFPNPVVTRLNLRLELAESKQLSYSLSDLNGKILLQKIKIPLPKGIYQEEMDLGQLPAGVYLLRVSCDDQQATIPVAVQRP